MKKIITKQTLLLLVALISITACGEKEEPIKNDKIEDNGSNTEEPTESVLNKEEGFLFGYSFDGGLDPDKSSKGDLNITTSETLSYVEGIKPNTKAVDLTGKSINLDYTLSSEVKEMVISFWVKSDISTGNQTTSFSLVKFKEGSFNSAFHTFFYLYQKGNKTDFTGRFYDNNTHRLYGDEVLDKFKAAQWNHVAIVVHKKNNQLTHQISVNGSLDNSIQVLSSPNANVRLFKNKFTMTLNSDKEAVQIDNLKFYEKAQTEDFIINDLGDKTKN